jgi:prepilin-type N-terminal cleavage/methylation domain-containing protein
MKKNKQGFTLIELLVVIAIIGLLSTLSIVALNQARARSRDARRLADVKQIQTALEMYYNDLNSYPADADVVAGQKISSSTTVYMDIVPKPPLPADGNSAGCGGAIVYTYDASAINGITNGTYTLNYCLGSNTGGIPSGLNTATPSGIGLRSIP